MKSGQYAAMVSSEARQALAAVVAFAAGAALLLVPLGSGQVPFRETPRYPVWVFLIAVVCASCPVVWGRGVRALAQLPARHSLAREALTYGGCASVLAAGLLLGPALVPWNLATAAVLPYFGLRITLVYTAVTVAIAPGIIAMYRIWGACLHGDPQLPELVSWRVILQAQLTALGALIALATLTTAALRNAVLAVASARPDDFPAEYVLLFGAVLTGLVALAYLPPSEQLRTRARALVTDTFPLPGRLDGDWQQQLERRRDLSALLRIDENSSGAIQNALIIGGPLITSALSLLIPNG